MYCSNCKVKMKQMGGNRSYHKQKKFKCPKCGMIRMQKEKRKK